jgi:hypothetical protein
MRVARQQWDSLNLRADALDTAAVLRVSFKKNLRTNFRFDELVTCT